MGRRAGYGEPLPCPLSRSNGTVGRSGPPQMKQAADVGFVEATCCELVHERGPLSLVSPANEVRRPGLEGDVPVRDMEGVRLPAVVQLSETRIARGGMGYAHPSCCIVATSFQIFVMWRILSPSKAMS